MTAGTVVITGGILATVILLCIIAVLCYCRLQYYCCKRNESEGDAGSTSGAQPQFACNACSAPGVDGAAVTPLCLPPDPVQSHSYCPTCAPYGTPFYIRTGDEVLNGGERVAYVPSHYKTPPMALGPPALPGASLSARSLPDFYTNRRAISTEV